MKLPRGLRNNNPGNIEDGKFAKSLPGYVGSDGRFAVFDSLDAGAHAMQKLLSGYQRKGITTVDGVINRWAPPTENDSRAYAQTVAKHLGVKPGDTIDLNDPDTLSKLSTAMAGVENGRAVPLAYIDGSALGASAPKNGAVAAVEDMAAGRLAGVPANRVQTVAFVPPPFSGQQTDFKPLFNTDSPSQPEQAQQPYQMETQQAPSPIEQPSQPDNSEDILKMFLPPGADTAPAMGAGEPTQGAQSGEDLLKAFLPKEAPAAAMETAKDASQSKSMSDVTLGEVGSGVNNVVRSVATGVPIIGGLLNKANAATNALIAPAINPMLSEENQLKGGTWSERYANSLAEQEGMDSQYAKDHPIANAVGNVVGGVGATVPLVIAAPAAMGASGTASLGANMLAGGASGMAIGAADSGVRSGGDLNETLKGGGLGLMFGAGAPVAGKVIGAGVNKLASTFSGMTPKGAAANALKESVANSGNTIDDIAAEMSRNPRLAPMDIDPNLQIMAQDLSSKPGAPRGVLSDAASARAASAKDTVTSAYDSAAGSVPDVKVYLDNLKQTTASNAKTAFGDALKGAKPVDITPVLDKIDSTISPGINGVVSKTSDIPQGPVEQALSRVRAKLANGNEMLTDADRLHTIQSALRTEADTLAKSASGQDKLVANALRDVRAKLVDQIDQATGGKFKPAQKQFADDNAIQDAFDKGMEVFKGGTGKNALENRPEYWQAWVKDATPAELEAAKVGTRVAADQAISSVRNAAAKGEALANVDFNVGRLEALLGKQETAKLVQTLKDEQRIAQTNAKLFAGSQTAPRQAVNQLTAVKEVTPGISLNAPIAIGGGYSVGGLPGAAAGGALSLGRMGVQAAQRARDIARNRLIAEAIVGDVTKLRDAVAAGSSIPQFANRLQMGTNRLITSGGPAGVNLLASPGMGNAPGMNNRRGVELRFTKPNRQ